MKFASLSIVFMVFAFACKSQKNDQKEKPLETGSFKVISIDGHHLPTDRISLNVDLEKNEISGNTGCNTYSTNFILNDKSMKIGFAKVTKRYCEGGMKVERKLLGNLKEVQTYTYKGKKLQLKSKDEKTLITATQVENKNTLKE